MTKLTEFFAFESSILDRTDVFVTPFKMRWYYKTFETIFLVLMLTPVDGPLLKLSTIEKFVAFRQHLYRLFFAGKSSWKPLPGSLKFIIFFPEFLVTILKFSLTFLQLVHFIASAPTWTSIHGHRKMFALCSIFVYPGEQKWKDIITHSRSPASITI